MEGWGIGGPVLEEHVSGMGLKGMVGLSHELGGGGNLGS